MSILLAKLFVDRQLTPNTETIAYMVKHMDRSFAEARRLVRNIDQASLAKKRKVSRALAAEVMNT